MINFKSVLVLGANGFIGSHLVSWLRDRGIFVIGVDRSGSSNHRLELQPPQEFIQLQMPDPQFAKILNLYRPEAIVNAAGPASVANSLVDPGNDFRGSIQVCFHILEALREQLPECKFLYLSSAAVYGNVAQVPIQENTPPQPISPYGYHKLICEIMLEEYSKIFKLKTSSVRIFSAFGPGLHKQVVWDIYQKSQTERELLLYGTGEETRDFIYVDDIAQGIGLILDKGDFQGDIYNLANGTEVSIRTLADCFLNLLGLSDMKVRFSGASKSGDPQKWCADIGKLQELGFMPKYNLAQGLEEYIKGITGKQGKFHE